MLVCCSAHKVRTTLCCLQTSLIRILIAQTTHTCAESVYCVLAVSITAQGTSSLVTSFKTSCKWRHALSCWWHRAKWCIQGWQQMHHGHVTTVPQARHMLSVPQLTLNPKPCIRSQAICLDSNAMLESAVMHVWPLEVWCLIKVTASQAPVECLMAKAS